MSVDWITKRLWSNVRFYLTQAADTEARGTRPRWGSFEVGALGGAVAGSVDTGAGDAAVVVEADNSEEG